MENSDLCFTCFKSNCPLRCVLEKATGNLSFFDLIEKLSFTNVHKDRENNSLMICYKCQESAIISYEFHQACVKSMEMLKTFEEEEGEKMEMKQQNIDDIADEVHFVEYDACYLDYEFSEQIANDISNENEENSMESVNETNQMYAEEEEEAEEAEEELVENELENEEVVALDEDQVIEEIVYNCDVCQKYFDSEELLEKHLETHEVPYFEESDTTENEQRGKPKDRMEFVLERTDDNKYLCPICVKPYKTKDTLRRHIVVIHTDKKKLKCRQCPREFFFQRDLNFHLKCHLNPIKYLCEDCDSEFSSKVSLRNHQQLMHVEPDSKAFQCSICDKRLRTKYALKNHLLLTHKKLRQFECTFEGCNQKFSQKSILQRHMKTCHEENMYQCDYCNNEETFEKLRDLKNHYTQCQSFLSTRN